MYGVTYSRALELIAYPHIQTHRLYSPATVNAQVLDLSVAPVKVGYIMGSGDQVPDALRRMGVDTLPGDPIAQVHDLLKLADADVDLEHAVNVSTFAVIFAMAFGRIDEGLLSDLALALLLVAVVQNLAAGTAATPNCHLHSKSPSGNSPMR